MCVSTSFSATRGGGSTPARPLPNAEIVVIKLKEYFRRQQKVLPYKIPDRRLAAFVLARHFGFSPVEIADALHVSPKSILRDLDAEHLFQKRSKAHQEQADALYRYIIYMAKFIH